MIWLRARQQQFGQSTVEFALAVPIFLVLVLGILEFSLIMWCRNVVAEAAQEGTRYAMVHGSKSNSPAAATDVENIVRNYGFGLNPDRLTVTCSWPSGNSPGSEVRVDVRYSYMPLSFLVLGGSPIFLNRTAVAYIVH